MPGPSKRCGLKPKQIPPPGLLHILKGLNVTGSQEEFLRVKFHNWTMALISNVGRLGYDNLCFFPSQTHIFMQSFNRFSMAT